MKNARFSSRPRHSADVNGSGLYAQMSRRSWRTVTSPAARLRRTRGLRTHGRRRRPFRLQCPADHVFLRCRRSPIVAAVAGRIRRSTSIHFPFEIFIGFHTHTQSIISVRFFRHDPKRDNDSVHLSARIGGGGTQGRGDSPLVFSLFFFIILEPNSYYFTIQEC